jgi:hypothetical protein
MLASGPGPASIELPTFTGTSHGATRHSSACSSNGLGAPDVGVSPGPRELVSMGMGLAALRVWAHAKGPWPRAFTG